MNIKIRLHLMPWELDYAILTYDRLAKSFYHFDKEDKVLLESCLNVSNYLINWEESNISKNIFINKYKTLKRLLPKEFTYNEKLYDGDQLYGHLDFERESISSEVDFYIKKTAPSFQTIKYMKILLIYTYTYIYKTEKKLTKKNHFLF